MPGSVLARTKSAAIHIKEYRIIDGSPKRKRKMTWRYDGIPLRGVIIV
jgi:hypothetical protein